MIVTGDHGHTSQIVEVGATPAGASSVLVTDEGAQMKVTYGTAAIDPATGFPAARRSTRGRRSGSAAYGPQAANVVGLIDQTELFTIMARALDVD